MHTLFSLGKSDAFKGLVVAVFSSVLSLAYQVIGQGGFSALNYQQILQVAILSAIGYLLKNYLTDDQGKFLGKI